MPPSACVDFAETVKQKGKVEVVADAWRSLPVQERLQHALVKRHH